MKHGPTVRWWDGTCRATGVRTLVRVWTDGVGSLVKVPGTLEKPAWSWLYVSSDGLRADAGAAWTVVQAKRHVGNARRRLTA